MSQRVRLLLLGVRQELSVCANGVVTHSGFSAIPIVNRYWPDKLVDQYIDLMVPFGLA